MEEKRIRLKKDIPLIRFFIPAPKSKPRRREMIEVKLIINEN